MGLNWQNVWRGIYAVTAKWLPMSCYSHLSRVMRAFFGKRILRSCGTNVNIERGATFGSDVSLGDYSGIGYFCEIHGTVDIGSYVMMAPRVRIYTVNHKTEVSDIPMSLQGSDEVRPVRIGDDCWIGDGVIILPGVEIGAHSIVGAGAVVSKSFPPYSVLGGAPARLLKQRV